MTVEFLTFIYYLLCIYLAGTVILVTWLYKSKKPFVIKGSYGIFVLCYIGSFLYLMPQEIRVDINHLFLKGLYGLMILGTLASLLPIMGGIRALWRWKRRYINGIILKSAADVEKFVKATFDDRSSIIKISFGMTGNCFAWQVSLYSEEHQAANAILLSIKARQKSAGGFEEVGDGDYRINGYRVRLKNARMYPLEIKAPSRK